ncbi:MAG: hypothetical protein GY705_27100, partial [Bacteroidetes bacterium]|nr:hypothetical protein [Bacteroidota bacterium]
PILLSVIFVFSTFVSFSQSKKLTADEAAIKEVIENESKFFWGRDYKGWKSTWVHDKHIVWTRGTRDGVRQIKGWKAWNKEVKSLWKAVPDSQPFNMRRWNYHFRIFGNGAWVTFDQDANGSFSEDMRVLEKTKKGWKIVMVVAIYDANESAEGIPDGE